MANQTQAGSTLSGQNVLVTGATGFVGSHLTRRLLDLGANVKVLARDTSDPEFLREVISKGAQVVRGTITDLAKVSEAADGVAYIFHIAALFRQAKFSDSYYYDVNVEGTRNVLNAARAKGVTRVVHCSTNGVHSRIRNLPADETEPYSPGDIYQETKCEGEKLARARFERGEVPGVVIRPAMIWGEGDRRILKLFRGVAKRRFPIIGTGKTLTHWIYIEDLVDAFLLAAQVEKALGQVYIIAGREAVTLEHVVNTVAKVAGVKPLPFKIPVGPVKMLGSLVEMLYKPFGVEPPIYRRRVDFFTKSRAFNTTKAQRELGFSPRYGFEEELERIYAWYLKEGWLA